MIAQSQAAAAVDKDRSSPARILPSFEAQRAKMMVDVCVDSPTAARLAQDILPTRPADEADDDEALAECVDRLPATPDPVEDAKPVDISA